MEVLHGNHVGLEPRRTNMATNHTFYFVRYWFYAPTLGYIVIWYIYQNQHVQCRNKFVVGGSICFDGNFTWEPCLAGTTLYKHGHISHILFCGIPILCCWPSLWCPLTHLSRTNLQFRIKRVVSGSISHYGNGPWEPWQVGATQTQNLAKSRDPLADPIVF